MSDLFADLPPIVASWLGDRLDDVELTAGEVLFEEGDRGDDLFIVEHGRLVATQRSPSGDDEYLGELARGEPVGEMAILTDEQRSATVRAIRDTRLRRLPNEAFLQLVTEHPQVLRPISERLIDRVRAASRRAQPSPAATVAIVAVTPSVDTGVVAAALTTAATRQSLTCTTATEYALDLEAKHDIVLLAPRDDRDAVIAAAAHADRILFTAHPGEGFDRDVVDAVVERTPITRRDLVVVHPETTTMPARSAWLATRLAPRRVHHLRPGNALDRRRLVRSVIDGEVALALSGGGARGLAHIGVWRALAEAGVPVDAVAGTSAGSIVAAMVAHTWPADAMVERFRSRLAGQRAALDLTPPAVSLASGEKITRRLQETFGDASIEDLWLAFYAVSTNLTRAAPQTHRTGDLWWAVRASVAVPGVFPPLCQDGDVLVDGGITNNLPVNVLRDHHPGATVIGVDVGNERELRAGDLPDDGVVSGWNLLGRRLNPFAESPQLNSLLSILMRVTELGNTADADRGDILIRPDVADFGLFDFARLDDLADAGYAATREALDRGGPAVERLLDLARLDKETT